MKLTGEIYLGFYGIFLSHFVLAGIAVSEVISLGNQNNQKLVARLEQVGIEVIQIKEKVRLKEQRVSVACDLIEKTAEQSQLIMDRFLSSTLKVEEKERELIEALAKVSDVIKKKR